MVEFLLAEDNNSVDSEEQPEYFYFAYYFRWPKTSSCVKEGYTVKFFFQGISWNMKYFHEILLLQYPRFIA